MRIATLFSLFLIAFLLSLNTFPAEAKIYKYKNKEGVVSFTDTIESIPKSLRNQVEIVTEETPQKDSVKRTVSEGKTQKTINNTLLINGLLIIIVILSLWCLKLWIKNAIFKFMARLLIKVGFLGLLYVILYHLFFSPENNAISRISSTVKKASESYDPIKKATKKIKSFQEKQEEYEKTLETIDSDP